MNIHINRQSDESLHMQICRQMEDKIRSGLLGNGTKLPSLRKFAGQLKVNPLTINKAYKELEKKGYLDIIHGKGVFVKNQKDNGLPKNQYDWQSSLSHYLFRSQFFHHHQPRYQVQLSNAVIHAGLLPAHFLAKEIKKMLEEEPRALVTYSPVQGDEELRFEIAEYLAAHCSLETSMENVLITSGIQQAIELIAKTFIGPGDIVITEAPTYSAAIDVFLNRGAKMISVPVDEHGLRTDLLSQIIHKYPPKLIYVNPNFQNPTGTVMSLQRRKELLEMAQLHEAIIVEDDTFHELFFDNTPPPLSMKSLDRDGHVIYLKGFSKAIAPGVRIGAVVSDGAIPRLLTSAKASMDLGSPLLIQKAILPFFKTQRMLEHMEKLRIALQLRRDHTMEILKQYVDDHVSWVVPKGGLNLWLTFPKQINTDELLLELQKHSITFLPGSACYPYDPEFHHLRLSYSLLSEDELKKGVHAFGQLVKKYVEEKLGNSE
jgi:DNA-binding transcriptional MocR family regulator